MGKVSRALNKSTGNLDAKHDNIHAISKDNTEETTPIIEDIHVHPESMRPHDTTPARDTGGEWDERLLITTEYYSSIAENFRKLRTLILHPETESPPQSILIVSAAAQEGKSFIAANLGISVASDFVKQALLLDFDLRRPSLHTLFGYNNSRGIVDYLSGKEVLPELLLKTQLSNLSIIPAGPPPDNPSELITSEQSITLIKEMLDFYDDRLVLLDSPPVLAASETLVLSQIVDKVIVVVRWGRSGREEVKKVVDQVGREKIIGVVFNAFEENILDRKIQDAGYYNYYYESPY